MGGSKKLEGDPRGIAKGDNIISFMSNRKSSTPLLDSRKEDKTGEEEEKEKGLMMMR